MFISGYDVNSPSVCFHREDSKLFQNASVAAPTRFKAPDAHAPKMCSFGPLWDAIVILNCNISSSNRKSWHEHEDVFRD